GASLVLGDIAHLRFASRNDALGEHPGETAVAAASVVSFGAPVEEAMQIRFVTVALQLAEAFTKLRTFQQRAASVKIRDYKQGRAAVDLAAYLDRTLDLVGRVGAHIVD
ncbi:MAG TPA: hypothetical protein VGY54_07775, partial [Polyangiaceae bacterium]|nr:hypothetical protein [Polyangiaceae bacterium]